MAKKDNQAGRNAKGSRRAAAGDAFFTDSAYELPRADIEGVTKAKSRAKFMRGYVIASCILLPFTAVGYLALLPGYLNAADAATAAQITLDTPAKAAATNAISQWLNSDADPLPGGFMLSWDGTMDSIAPTVVTDENGQQTATPGLETHKFTLGTKSGALFTSTVQVSWDDINGPQVTGGPSLDPQAPSVAGDSGVDLWPGTSVSTPSEALPQSVEAWVESYTSGQPDKLRLATGDPSSDNSYVPLVQVASADKVKVGASATREDGLTIARVSFDIRWEGTPVDDRGEPLTPSATVTYDVLVDKADTASPIVVAWGGPGTGLDLEPYSNAVSGRDVNVQDRKVWTDEELEERAASAPKN